LYKFLRERERVEGTRNKKHGVEGRRKRERLRQSEGARDDKSYL
jgi:hypothetical protein